MADTSPGNISTFRETFSFQGAMSFDRHILAKKHAVSRISKRMENALKTVYFHAYGFRDEVLFLVQLFLRYFLKGFLHALRLVIQEKLNNLRVERNLTLVEQAEQTGISSSALGKYEADDYKDISPFSIVTLAKFYSVSTDYLL